MKPIQTTLISFIVTALIVGGGTYYFVNTKATKDKNNLQSQITDLNKKLADGQATATPIDAAVTTPSTTTTTAPAPVATMSTTGWKTFTNKTYNFSFKYPAEDVAQDDTSSSDSDVTISNNDAFWLYTITVKPNTTNKTLAQVAKQHFDSLSAEISGYAASQGSSTQLVIKQSDLSIDGIPAKKMGPGHSIAYSPSAEVVLIKNNNIITISPRGESDEFNTILSTFKFTN